MSQRWDPQVTKASLLLKSRITYEGASQAKSNEESQADTFAKVIASSHMWNGSPTASAASLSGSLIETRVARLYGFHLRRKGWDFGSSKLRRIAMPVLHIRSHERPQELNLPAPYDLN